jgi:hypothetical protein
MPFLLLLNTAIRRRLQRNRDKFAYLINNIRYRTLIKLPVSYTTGKKLRLKRRQNIRQIPSNKIDPA